MDDSFKEGFVKVALTTQEKREYLIANKLKDHQKDDVLSNMKAWGALGLLGGAVPGGVSSRMVGGSFSGGALRGALGAGLVGALVPGIATGLMRAKSRAEGLEEGPDGDIEKYYKNTVKDREE